jgi:hypothetical protein
MQRFVALFFPLVLLLGCGGRTSMEGCKQGDESCSCYPNSTCNAGLVCVVGVCEFDYSGGASGATGFGGSGGQLGEGGQLGYGGQLNVGGQSGSGGFVGSGGTMRTGGRSGSGGYFGGGGLPGSGGIASGGTPNFGGASGAGGVAGKTGTSVNSGQLVTFANGQASGAMTGKGWVALGAQDTVIAPTCQGTAITSANACTSTTTWPSSSALCITGAIPAVTGGDYSSNWGILIGVDVTDPAGGTLGVSFQSVAFSVSGAPTQGLRAEVHRQGDAVGSNYCANMVPGSPIAFTAFNTACWDGSGVSLAAADVPNIDWAGIQASSGLTAFKLSNFCLNSISFK